MCANYAKPLIFMFHFRCIFEGRCRTPVCEFGSYRDVEGRGRCPQKSEQYVPLQEGLEVMPRHAQTPPQPRHVQAPPNPPIPEPSWPRLLPSRPNGVPRVEVPPSWASSDNRKELAWQPMHQGLFVMPTPPPSRRAPRSGRRPALPPRRPPPPRAPPPRPHPPPPPGAPTGTRSPSPRRRPPTRGRRSSCTIRSPRRTSNPPSITGPPCPSGVSALATTTVASPGTRRRPCALSTTGGLKARNRGDEKYLIGAFSLS